MQLTHFSDYALRVVLYLAMHEDRLVSIREVSETFGVSPNHLVKVVQVLVREGLVASTRGRSGGLRLAVAPSAINLGALIRKTEPHLNLLECFDLETNSCPIVRACGLKKVMVDAQRAFLGVLDGHTLADVLGQRSQVLRLLGLRSTPRAGATILSRA